MKLVDNNIQINCENVSCKIQTSNKIWNTISSIMNVSFFFMSDVLQITIHTFN